ncbi:MAG: permease [Rhodospirillaceae bacterium]|jgi:uncharacterized protein|nr:permease [Rhodospirillaceae bacterium]MBT6206224.1 permease [Rhodospirillaceae bacterium]MBT6510687.1 permease [Rhodospirillaceae bacterium]MBT7612208.1 permease [Rhodospirillaceae bacterium]
MTDLSLAPTTTTLRRTAGYLTSVWLLIALIPLGILILDPVQFPPIMEISIRALLGTLPYIAVAVLLIATLKASGAEAVVARAFVGRPSRMIVLAALFGGLAPFCSCEVIPFIAGLLALGVPLPAVMAFWLASPLIDPPTLFITAGALGWEFAVGKAIAAVSIGLMGGFALKAFMTSGAFADPLRPRTGGGCASCGTSPFDGRPVWRFWREEERRATFRREGTANAIFLLKWLAFAYLLEGLLITYVPAEAIGPVVGGDCLLSIMIAAFIGAPAYLNSYAAPPLVAGLMEQGMSPGAAMAFMVGGAVSSIPAMAAVWSLVKAPVFASYMILGIGGAIIVGAVFGAVLGG